MKKTSIIISALSVLVLLGILSVVFFERKDIKKEELEGLKIGMSINDARKKYPNLICETEGGYKCSGIVNEKVVEIEVNSDEKVYAVLSAVIINSMEINQLLSAAKQEYQNADLMEDGTRFYWYYDEKGDAYKFISISQNNSYPWFCSSYTSALKPPNCKSDSIILVKRLVDLTKKTIWFDKNSPELQKIK